MRACDRGTDRRGGLMSSAKRGLCEAHAHLFQLGRSLSMLDLSSCGSRDEMISAMAQRGLQLEPDQWVLAHGARPDGWDDPVWPSRVEIDRACPGRGVVAWCFDYHAMVASTPALQAAQITKDTVIESGVIDLDGSGEPSGLLLEHAALRMWNAVPEPSQADRHRLIRDACLHLQSLGYERVHDLKSQPWLGGVLSDLIVAGEVQLSAVLFPLMKHLRQTRSESSCWISEQVSLGGGKVFVDGTFNSRTALMLEPFADGHKDFPCGKAMMKPAQIEHMLMECRDSGVALASHAIGDGAVRAVLDAIEHTGTGHTGCRIEHAELIDRSDVPRFNELGVIASLQPCHLLPDIEALRKAVPDRLDRVLPIAELIRSGLVPGQSLIFGSDVPIVGADPNDSIQAAVHRRREGMGPSEAIAPEQAIDEATAWACFETQ